MTDLQLIREYAVRVKDDEDVSERETIPCPPPKPRPTPETNRQVPGQRWACGTPMAPPCDRPTLRPPAVRP